MMDAKTWNRFLVSVAMACTMRSRPQSPLSGQETADFISDVLRIALDGSRIKVEQLPYPVTGKVPLLLSDGTGFARLFWYYPAQSKEDMGNDLADLISELEENSAVPATA